MLSFNDYTESTEFPGIFTRVLRPANAEKQTETYIEVRRGSDGYNFGPFTEASLSAEVTAFLADPAPEGPISLKAQLDAFNAPAPDGSNTTDELVQAGATPDRDNEAAPVADTQPPMPDAPLEVVEAAPEVSEDAVSNSRRERSRA